MLTNSVAARGIAFVFLVALVSASLSAQTPATPATPDTAAPAPGGAVSPSATTPPADQTTAPAAPATVDATAPGKKDKIIVGPPGAPAISPAAEGPIVRAIEIRFIGPRAQLSNAVIESNMRTTVGQPYSAASVEEDVKNLYATGYFNNLQITDEPLADGVKVIVFVIPKATIKDIQVKGCSRIKESRVRKEIKSKIAGPLIESQVSQDCDKIRDLYLNKGFSHVQVSYKIDTNDTYGRSIITFIVNEGSKAYVTNVIFVGNEHLTTKELAKVLKTKKKNLLSFINKSGVYNQDDFRQDLVDLRDYYVSKGFIDMSIKDVSYTYPGKDEMCVTITIFEGIQYTVGKITFTGNTIFPEAQLRTYRNYPIIRMSEGTVFSPRAYTAPEKEPNDELASMENDLKRLHDLYGTKGYLEGGPDGTDIEPSQQPNVESGKMDIVYNIKEGSQSYIDQIIIQGNGHTKDKVIRREVLSSPGEIYDSVRVKQTQKVLEGLGYFSKVDISPEETNVPNRKNMQVTVEEKRTGSVTFGAGFSSVDSLLGFVEVTQGNFDLFNFPSFTGGGEKFRLRLQYGLQTKDVDLSFEEPWFLEQRLALGFDLFYHDAQYLSSYYNQRQGGASVTLKKAISQFWVGSISYTLQDIDLYNFQQGASPTLLLEKGSRTESSVTLGARYDTRDSLGLTRHGSVGDLTAQVAGGPLLGQTNIYKFNGDFAHFYTLPDDVILSFRGSTGVVNYYGSSARVPIFDRFFLGGPSTVRGFNYRSLGPLDTSGQAIGGLTDGYENVEATFPIIDRVRGAVFSDAGFVDGRFAHYTSLWPELQASVGIGLRLNLPIGPLRLDYGFPIKRDDHALHNGKFSFDVGYQSGF